MSSNDRPATVEGCVRAYKVACQDDDHGAEVVFARRAKDVDRYSHSEMCDCPFIERTVHRATAFDKYAPGPVSIEQYLAEGWYWECGGCSRPVYDSPEVVIADGHVYHNADCIRRYLDSWKDIGPNAHESVRRSLAAAQAALQGATHV